MSNIRVASYIKDKQIPIQDENGLYFINGHKYYMIYQMVEKSTYTSRSSVTIKSLMPIACKRNIVEVKDSDGNNYSLPSYYVFVFRKEISIILFYLAHGIDYTLNFLHVNDIVDFLPELPEDPDTEKYIYFSLSSKCVLRVIRYFFQKYTYIQGIVGMFADVCTNRITVEQLDDKENWIKKISNPNNYEKGLGILQYFGRLLDNTTINILKLPEYHKKDIYHLLRWVMSEFNELRLKDNCDLAKLFVVK